MPKLKIFISFLLITFQATNASAFDQNDMKTIANRLGVGFENGTGEINGVEQTLSGFLGPVSPQSVEAAVRAHTTNKYTVTNEWSPYGRVIVVAKIYSAMCPRCPKPTASNVRNILNGTYAITVFENTSGMNVVGSKTGQIINHGLDQQKYSGNWLGILADQSDVKGFSKFHFSASQTQQLTGTFEGTQAEAFALIERSMMNAGYERIFATSEDNGILSHWRRDRAVTRIQLSEPNQNQIAWQAYEVVTP